MKMIRELTLKNFRAFRSLHLANLGRVNLLVGANNSGKTSVLEAISFLASGGDLGELLLPLARRGEVVIGDEERSGGFRNFVDIRNVFFGRKIGDASVCTLESVDENGVRRHLHLSTPRAQEADIDRWRNALARRSRRHDRFKLPLAFDADRAERIPRFLQITPNEGPPLSVALLPGGGLDTDDTTISADLLSSSRVLFLSTSGIDDEELANLFDEIVLTRDEETVTAALHTIEPGIIRIATRRLVMERGFVVGIEGMTEQVALGSLGDGVHRMLAIAICLVAAQGGYLLIDEIDTGLHHTVMRKMWTLVYETAKRLDVTVFATTHSYDCVHALAEITGRNEGKPNEVALLRIEQNNPDGIHFSEEEIAHLADWQIEAR